MNYYFDQAIIDEHKVRSLYVPWTRRGDTLFKLYNVISLLQVYSRWIDS